LNPASSEDVPKPQAAAQPEPAAKASQA